MPLSRQLVLSLFSIFLALFIGAVWISVSNTKNFIEQQLSSHAQDTATSLGMSITSYIGDKDMPLIETMVNAIFDRGYYSAIVLKDADGKVILERRNPVSLEQVPSWFINMFPLSPPVRVTELNDGWTIAGQLSVQSDPGIGYGQLWDNASDSFQLILLMFLVGLVLVWFLVRMITIPIMALVKQSEAISQQKFDRVELKPKTLELRIIVDAINLMSERLSDLFGRLTNQAERYRDFAYSDELTKVGNRRAFDLAFEQILSDAEHQTSSFLMFVRLSSLNQVNCNIGFLEGDAYIKTVSDLLSEHLNKQDIDFTLYRLNGGDFALIIEGIDEVTCLDLCQQLIDKCNAIEKSEYESGTAQIAAGSFNYGDRKKAILEQVDSALTQANFNPLKWQAVDKLQTVQSNDTWREKIKALLDKDTADFIAQPIKSFSGDEIYQEWFARFPEPDSKQHIPMAELIPATIRLDFSQKLDELLVRCAFTKLSSQSGTVGLNISRLSLLKPSFQHWFVTQLTQLGAQCSHLVLEIPERCLFSDTNNFLSFIVNVQNLGVKITIERFGAQIASVTHLRAIKPDYLKLDGRFTKNIHTEKDNQLFVHSLVDIAHGLNIKVIAVQVETAQEAQTLKDMQVDFVQGFFVGAPIALEC
ncbi:EAL domain-containing protein [Paraglaciecola sp. MB-3u-78]|uniref:bifunctional diguanylate cyclase/phosphodiesterase n=1 Tax=Paraglaciecola sp. MB-3u-78 TaxID=2058332 RepID=UPI000C334DCD|nr:EAL domain-containing protein [Paraglaciecola sp. MB-3u-78]PKG98744.1 GGDEF domain-containing protein [Paraglaciecola sp. MB-3u-78]